MKKQKNIFKTISLILIVFLILILGIFVSMISGNSQDNEEKKGDDNLKSQKKYENVSLEVYHFHGTNQCASCIAVGDLAEKTINTYFEEEIESGKIKFDHINAELPENYELAKKYEATGSSLWIGTYMDEEFHKEKNTRVWYKINDEQDYMTYLKGVIEKRLNGNLN
jgi:hypothetical protein